MRARLVVLAAILSLTLLSISSVGTVEAKPDSPDQDNIRANRPDVTPSGTIPATPATFGTPAMPAQPGHQSDGYILITSGGISCSEGVKLTPAVFKKIFGDWPVGNPIASSEGYILYPVIFGC